MQYGPPVGQYEPMVARPMHRSERGPARRLQRGPNSGRTAHGSGTIVTKASLCLAHTLSRPGTPFFSLKGGYFHWLITILCLPTLSLGSIAAPHAYP